MSENMDLEDVIDSIEYHLYGQAYGHAADVRDVVGLPNDMFASCSRDGTIKIWHNVGGIYEHKKTLTGHANPHKMGISSLLYIKPGSHPVFKDGCMVSAAYDKSICVWDVPDLSSSEDAKPTLNLWGHEEAPVSLSVSKEGNILSGGSDNTARAWGGNRCILQLKGHQFPIWAIIGLSNGDIVTGSGDRTVKIWRGGKCIKTLTEHKDAVRGLTDVPGVGFLSSSNDGTICMWTYDGILLQVLHGHEGFVYKVIYLPSRGEFASCSEDGTVKIWKDSNCVQTLVHPSGLWSVCALDNGDLVTGGQDGTIRIWSKNPTRIATEDVINAYTNEITESRRVKELADLNVDQLPGTEALLVPGTKDNQHLMIQKEGKPHMYTWNLQNKTWDYVGEIQGAKEDKNSRKGTVMDGVTYDFVFDVDLEDGRPHRKLPFNLGEDPYLAAQYFIETEQLDQNFLDQIAKFIIQNVPDWNKVPHKAFYRPGSGQKPSNTQSQSSQTTQQHQIPPSNSNNFPQRQPVLFEGGNFENILAKIKAFDKEFSSEQATASFSLSTPEIILVESTFSKVMQTSRYHVSNFTSKEYGILEKLITWPPKNLFPVLDFLRLMVLHPEASRHWISSGFIAKVLTAGLKKEDSHPANVMLTFRFVANLFMLPSVRTKITTYQEEILEKITDCFPGANKNTKLTLSTTLLNFTVLYLTEPNEQGITQSISVINEALTSDGNDDETNFRLLVALGTMIYFSKERQSLAQDVGLADALQPLTKSTNSKIATCANELLSLIK